MGKHRSYKDAFKLGVLNEYFNGARSSDLEAKYDISRNRIYRWRNQWKEHGSFPDNRGKKATGRPKLKKISKEEMTKDEYIEYLEMQLEIKKYLAFYEKRKQK